MKSNPNKSSQKVIKSLIRNILRVFPKGHKPSKLVVKRGVLYVYGESIYMKMKTDIPNGEYIVDKKSATIDMMLENGITPSYPRIKSSMYRNIPISSAQLDVAQEIYSGKHIAGSLITAVMVDGHYLVSTDGHRMLLIPFRTSECDMYAFDLESLRNVSVGFKTGVKRVGFSNAYVRFIMENGVEVTYAKTPVLKKIPYKEAIPGGKVLRKIDLSVLEKSKIPSSFERPVVVLWKKNIVVFDKWNLDVAYTVLDKGSNFPINIAIDYNFIKDLLRLGNKYIFQRETETDVIVNEDVTYVFVRLSYGAGGIKDAMKGIKKFKRMEFKKK